MEQLSKEENIPLTAAHEIYYVKPEEAESQEVLLCIKNGHKLGDSDREMLPTDEFYLLSPDEMETRFSHLPDALAASEKIASECNVDLVFNQQLIPKYPLPEGTASTDYLKTICLKGAAADMGNRMPEFLNGWTMSSTLSGK